MVNGKKIFWFLKGKIRRKYRSIRRDLFLFFHFKGANKNVTIISNNCIGGWLYQRINGQYYSPTMFCLIPPDDFIIFVKNLEKYLKVELIESEPFVEEYNKIMPGFKVDFPCAKLGEIKILFPHSSTFEDARKAWNKRRGRVSFDNIRVILYAFDNYINDSLLNEFKSIEYKKVMLTSKEFFDDCEVFNLNIKNGENWYNTIHEVKGYWEVYGWKKFLK